MADKHKPPPYAFTLEFERQVVALLCTGPRFHGLVGRELDAESMPTDPGRLAVEAVQEIARDTGSGPSSALLVVQRLRRWMDEGRVTVAEIHAVDDMVSEAEDLGLQPEAEVVAELAPILKRRIQSRAIKLAMTQYSAREDMEAVTELLDRAEAVGRNDRSLGTKVGSGSFDEIDALRALVRLPTGIQELDAVLGGGLPRGQLGLFIGGSGDGKSMALAHVCTHAMRGGLFAAYATLELPPPIVSSRIIANYIGYTIDRVMARDPDAERELADSPPPGLCVVKEFSPQVTTMVDIRQWLDEVERAEGREVDLLAVDYADKMTANIGDKGQYKIMEAVYESLRLLVHERRKWGFTASAATRADKGQKKRLDLEHAADSQNKVRVVDLVITLNVREDGDEMLFYIAKNRTGVSRRSVGPLPTDFACGAIVAVERGAHVSLLALETERALAEDDQWGLL